MKAYGEVDVWINIFLTSALIGGEWSASHPCHFTHGERASSTDLTGGWVGPGAGLDYVEPRKFCSSVVQPVASHYTNYDIMV
jgi:hypothetical protein